jgi:excisionase family DNA binding protein
MRAADQHVPFRERITCTVREAVEATGFGRRTIYRLLDSGRLSSVKIGDKRLIHVRSLVALLDPPSVAAE